MTKILIVEDDGALLQVLYDKLTLEGFSTLTAKDGVEGLEVALKEHPNLILLDLIMPRMTGMEMIAKLRGDKWGKSVPVILLTNLNDSRKMADALDKDVHEYIIKADWTLENVIQKIKEKLNITGPLSAGAARGNRTLD